MIGEVSVSIAGVGMRWRSDCAYEVEELERLFRYHRREAPASRDATEHLIEFRPVWEPLCLPEDAVCYYTGRIHRNNRIRWYRLPEDGGDCIILSDEIWIVHDRKAACSVCCLRCRRLPSGCVERPAVSDAIVILLHTVMSMYHRYAIHGAAVAFDGAAHLFAGESGHGKSTLCTDLIRQHAAFMGDDIVFLFLKGERVMVGSLLFDAKIVGQGAEHRKEFVDVMRVYDARSLRIAPLACLYYIDRTEGPASWLERLEPVAAAARLIHASNNARMQYDVEQWQRVCRRTAETVPFYCFRYGDRRSVTEALFRDVR